MSISPTRSLVLLRIKKKTAQQRDSGIFLPSEADRDEGVVEATGPQVQELKVGDRVLFNPYGYDEIEKDLFLINETSIIAKIL